VNREAPTSDGISRGAFIAIIPGSILRRWDALPQLCEALLRQDESLERLDRMHGDSDYWYDQYLAVSQQFADAHDSDLALTVDGTLTPIPTVYPCADDRSLPSAKQAGPAVLPPGSVGMVPRFPCTGRGSLEDEQVFERSAPLFLTANEMY